MYGEDGPFTILEYIEFDSHEEFLKYKDAPRIEQNDIDACDMEELVKQLQEEQGDSCT